MKDQPTPRRPRHIHPTVDGNCHDHVLPAKVTSTDTDSRLRGYEQKVTEDHYRWRKRKAQRINARKARKINRRA